MDDPPNNEYSRAPESEDLAKLCRSLSEHGVKYLVIGGWAVILHGAARFTKDVDLLVDTSVANIQKIKKAMAILPDNAIALIADDEVSAYQVVRVADEFVTDLMAKACGITYDEAKESIEWREIDGVKIPIVSKEMLIKMKNTYRPSDKADVIFLNNLLEEERKQKRK
ncbi:MAG: nucleotidyltransferase [Deltaproteobacteria bacterium]|nr:nucleotidyltransferase [Deltaproteobacteria bacterium]